MVVASEKGHFDFETRGSGNCADCERKCGVVGGSRNVRLKRERGAGRKKAVVPVQRNRMASENVLRSADPSEGTAPQQRQRKSVWK